MKKLLLFTTVFLISINCIAQEGQNDDQTDSQKRLDKFNEVKKHEVSLDVVAAIAGLGINPRYEYVLGRYSGVGVDLNIGILDDEDTFDYYETFSITPYYRQYFFSKEDYGAKGFYGEGFLKYYSFRTDNSFFSGNSNDFDTTTFNEISMGVGIGWKWVSDSGFLIDVGIGIGRNLGIADDRNETFNLPEISGRGGVNFGWRF